MQSCGQTNQSVVGDSRGRQARSHAGQSTRSIQSGLGGKETNLKLCGQRIQSVIGDNFCLLPLPSHPVVTGSGATTRICSGRIALGPASFYSEEKSKFQKDQNYSEQAAARAPVCRQRQ